MFQFILSLVLLGVLFVVFYIIVATVLKWLPSNRKAAISQQGIDIWIVSNGPHTDLCLPLQSTEIDWTHFIGLHNFAPNQAEFVTFGWGDKGFYLETPSWAELKPKTAFKALFKLSHTTMQVILHEELPEGQKFVKKLRITPKQYKKIISYIKNSFLYTDQKELIPIDFAGLPAYEGLNYQFYEAVGSYHFFKTCNCWVNNALKVADIRTATWAPFSKSIFYQLNKFYPDTDSSSEASLSIYGESNS